MSHNIDLKRIEQKVLQDYYQDGLVEILIGVLFATMAAAPLIPVAPFLAFFILAPGYRALKKRFTYPRIGYVEPIGEEPKTTIRGMLAFTLTVIGVMVLALVILGDVTDTSQWYRWMPALSGSLTTGGFIYMAGKSGLVRFHAFTVISLVSGFVFSLCDFDSKTAGLSLHLLLMAGVMLLCGAALFARFLRSNPLTTEEVTDAVE